MTSKKIVDGVYWVGVNDYTNELFEGIWPIPDGVSINSYVVKTSKKTALIDIIKKSGGSSGDSLLHQLNSVPVDITKLDYIILNHLEPDHTGYLDSLRKLCPTAEILTSKKGVPLVEKFFKIKDKVRAVSDGEELDLGDGRVLTFYEAPNVHWPETMVTYDKKDKILFSCDAFGSYGAMKGYIFDDEVPDSDKKYFEDETLRYYANIVATFSNSVLKAIEKLGGLDIKIIAPSHGLVWRTHPEKIIKDYIRLANYHNDFAEPEITVIWGSMYGNTEAMLQSILVGIADEGVKVHVHKVPETNLSWVLASAWRSAGIVVGMPTYEYDMFPPISYVLDIFKKKHVWHKKTFRFGSFGWVGGAQKHYEEFLNGMKWEILPAVEFQGAPTEDDLKKGREKGSELAKLVKAIPKKE